MADTDHPWADVPDQVTPPGEEPQGDLRQQWSQFLAKPESQGMMLQFGLSLLQPYAAGQSAIGHFGQSVGSVGEFVDRNRKAGLEERKMDLAETVADDKLELGTQKLQTQQERNNTIAAQNAHRLTLQQAGLNLRQANLERLTARDKADLDRRERELGRKLSRDETWAFFKERGLELTQDELDRKVAADEARRQYQELSIAQRERELQRRLTEDERRELRSRLDREGRERRGSLSDSFRRTKEYRMHVDKEVKSAEAARDNVLDPDGQARWKGMTRAQIEEKILRDPATRRNFLAKQDPDKALTDDDAPDTPPDVAPAPAPAGAPVPSGAGTTPPQPAATPAPTGAPGTQAPAPVQQAVPTGPSGFPLLPPKNKRIVGQKYDNGRGFTGTWTGTGLVQGN